MERMWQRYREEYRDLGEVELVMGCRDEEYNFGKQLVCSKYVEEDGMGGEGA